MNNTLSRKMICSLMAVLLLVAGCSQGGERDPREMTAERMLEVADVPGATASEIARIDEATICRPMKQMLHRFYSRSEELPVTTVRFDVINGITVQQTLIYDSTGSDPIGDYQYAVDTCVEKSPLRYKSDFQTTETFEVLDQSAVPRGVVGYTDVVTNEDAGAKSTIQRIFLRFDHEGKKGLMYLSVTNPSGEPADLSPMDLIDPALRKAEATLDHTGLGSLTPSPAPATADASEAPSATDSPTQSSE